MCLTGHSYDVNKRGFLTLADRSRGILGDTRAILDARDRFLQRGHYSPIVETIDAVLTDCGLPADAAADLVDSGCGTGYYAAALLARRPLWRTLELDVSVDAVTAAVRATGAPGVVADVWQPLPLRDHRADVVLCVFAPRNAGEFARVLRAEGRLVVVTPAASHLEQLRNDGRVIGMQSDKLDHLDVALGQHFVLEQRRSLEYTAALGANEVADLAGMGPSGHHGAHPAASGDNATSNAIGNTLVTIAVDVSVYQRIS